MLRHLIVKKVRKKWQHFGWLKFLPTKIYVNIFLLTLSRLFLPTNIFTDQYFYRPIFLPTNIFTDQYFYRPIFLPTNIFTDQYFYRPIFLLTNIFADFFYAAFFMPHFYGDFYQKLLFLLNTILEENLIFIRSLFVFDHIMFRFRFR